MLSLRPPRPIGVTIVAVLYCAGFLAGVAAGGIFAVYSRNSTQFVLGFVLAFLGVVCYVVGLGLFRGRTWAWAYGVVGYGVTLVITFVELVLGNFSTISGIILSLWIILYLNSARVKLFFEKPRLSLPAVAFGLASFLAFLLSLQVSRL